MPNPFNRSSYEPYPLSILRSAETPVCPGVVGQPATLVRVCTALGSLVLLFAVPINPCRNLAGPKNSYEPSLPGFSRRTASALATLRSSGVTTCMFRLDPGTATTIPPSRSISIESSQ